MDPRYSAQDILLCDLCQTTVLQNHCELCQINLCKACERKHLSDSSKRHKLVPYIHRTFGLKYPKCPIHLGKHSEHYCQKCDISVCRRCILSGKHHGHKLSDILQKIASETETLKRVLKELEEKIYPTYEELAYDVKFKRARLENHYEEISRAITKQGEDLHNEIDIVVDRKRSEINEIKIKHQITLNKQDREIEQTIYNIKQCIFDMKKLLDSNEVPLASAYKSRIAEFRRLPPKLNISLPNFSSQNINTEKIHEMFGTMSALSISTEEHGYTMKIPDAVTCLLVKPLFDEPELITTIDTGYFSTSGLILLSDDEIWTCGNNNIMKLYNLKGELLKSIKTKSENIPCDITVTKKGDLIYTDPVARTINLVRDEKIFSVIELQEWIPSYVCSASSFNFMVTMDSVDYKQSKIACYLRLTEKETIQFDSLGYPLFSPNSLKYITENRNLDICVVDTKARAVVVVNPAKKLRFRYTGHPCSDKKLFNPCGITTDSRCHILVSDTKNHSIHILDQDGHFIGFIGSPDVVSLCCICMDPRNNLFVARKWRGKVWKIKYM